MDEDQKYIDEEAENEQALSGSDSDPQDDELTGIEQNYLFEDIKGAINQFNDYFNTEKKNVKIKKNR